MEFRGDPESARYPISLHTGKASVFAASFVVARAAGTLPLPFDQSLATSAAHSTVGLGLKTSTNP